MKPARLVEVHWTDIATYPGWAREHPLSEVVPVQCRSVGYLLVKEKGLVKIAASMDVSNASYGDITVIPRVNVRRIRYCR